MSTKPENPYAYPNEQLLDQVVRHPGMTLRDYFAGQAIPAVIEGIPDGSKWSRVAELSYRIADYMLAERLK